MTMKHIAGPNDWPRLPLLEGWQDTCTTLNMWAQVVGKIRLTLSPDINHSWGSTLYVTTHGLTTSPSPTGCLHLPSTSTSSLTRSASRLRKAMIAHSL